jgi:hypothetical protein
MLLKPHKLLASFRKTQSLPLSGCLGVTEIQLKFYPIA